MRHRRIYREPVSSPGAMASNNETNVLMASMPLERLPIFPPGVLPETSRPRTSVTADQLKKFTLCESREKMNVTISVSVVLPIDPPELRD